MSYGTWKLLFNDITYEQTGLRWNYTTTLRASLQIWRMIDILWLEFEGLFPVKPEADNVSIDSMSCVVYRTLNHNPHFQNNNNLQHTKSCSAGCSYFRSWQTFSGCLQRHESCSVNWWVGTISINFFELSSGFKKWRYLGRRFMACHEPSWHIHSKIPKPILPLLHWIVLSCGR